MRKLNVWVLSILLVLATLSLAVDGKSEKEIIIKSRGVKLGVVVRNVDKDTRKELGITGGAEILEVVDDSPADEIGLKEGDIIIEFDGKPVESAADLRDYVDDLESEKTVDLVVLRDGKKKKFTTTIKSSEKQKVVRIVVDDGKLEIETNQPFIFPGMAFKKFREMMPSPVTKGAYLGVYVEELSDQLKQYFEVDHGVLIKEVEEDSPAEKAGLKAGDVILRIGDKEIEDYQDLIRTVNYYDPGDKVKIEISRKGKKITKTVELGKKKFPRYFYKLKPFEDRDEDEEGEAHSFIWFPEEFKKQFEISTEMLEKNLEKLEKRLKNIDFDLYIF